MDQAERIHILACPKARRAARLHDESIMWAIQTAFDVLNGKLCISEAREPNALTMKSVHFTQDCNFTLCCQRSLLFNNEIVLLISKYHDLDGASFDLALKHAAPLPLI